MFAKLKEKWQALEAREKAKMEHMTFRQKVEYLVTNWWLEFLIFAVIVAMIFSLCYMGYNATRERILFFVVVDSALTEDECQALTDDFEAYIGNTSKKEIVMLDPNVSVLGTVGADGVTSDSVMDHQQKSMLLIGSGLIDLYLCPEKYMEYLDSYNDVELVENILSEELLAQYADRITEDGKGILLSDTAAELVAVNYEPVYLVFTYNNHYPEVTEAFARYILEK